MITFATSICSTCQNTHMEEQPSMATSPRPVPKQFPQPKRWHPLPELWGSTSIDETSPQATQEGPSSSKRHLEISIWPLITLNVADHVCIYFYNFNHKNFYQGIQKFTYSIMNMLRQQNNRIKWIYAL